MLVCGTEEDDVGIDNDVPDYDNGCVGEIN
jgi:hypothetical protein